MTRPIGHKNLYRDLVQALGAANVFKDIDNIAAGSDCPAILDQNLDRATVVLCLIGQRWLGAGAGQRGRRIDDPTVFVRLEVARALQRNGVRIVPVLLDGTTMPASPDLPFPLRDLTRRNAVAIRADTYGGDAQALIAAIIGRTPPKTRETRGHRRWTRLALASLLLGLAAFVAVGYWRIGAPGVLLSVMREGVAYVHAHKIAGTAIDVVSTPVADSARVGAPFMRFRNWHDVMRQCENKCRQDARCAGLSIAHDERSITCELVSGVDRLVPLRVPSGYQTPQAIIFRLF